MNVYFFITKTADFDELMKIIHREFLVYKTARFFRCINGMIVRKNKLKLLHINKQLFSKAN